MLHVIMGLTNDQVKALHKLHRCSTAKKRSQLLYEGGPPLQKVLRECAHNLLKGTVPLTEKQRKILKKHALGIREIAKKKTTLKRRLLVEQKGGFLLSLLAPILTTLAGSLVSGLISRK